MLASDGSIISGNLPTVAGDYNPIDNRLFKCMVVGVNYVDSRENITKNAPNPQITYDVVIIGGYEDGQKITNCTMSSSLGGVYNYHEKVLRKSSTHPSKTLLNRQDGDIVLMQFLHGNPNCPQIIGACTNPLDKNKTGALITDGPRSIEQYNGINTLINKDGEYILTRKGGSYDAVNDYFIPSDESEYKGAAVSETKLAFLKDKTVLNGGDKIAIGAGAVELLQKISDQLQTISDALSAVATHTHVSVTSTGSPTPPVQAASFTSAASALDTIKTAIDSIKTTL